MELEYESAMGLHFIAMELFMTNEQAGASQLSNPGTHWAATVASLAVGASFFALWFWLLPPWLDFRLTREVRRVGVGLGPSHPRRLPLP